MSPVAVSTADWEVLSFSAGRVMSANPAPTSPCRKTPHLLYCESSCARSSYCQLHQYLKQNKCRHAYCVNASIIVSVMLTYPFKYWGPEEHSFGT